MAKTAWGIEVGTSSVKAVQLTHDGKGNVTLNDFTIIPLSSYRIEGADDSMATTAALRALVQDKEILPSDSCFVSLHGRNAFSRVVTLPPVSEDKIRETIANEARGQIPIRLEDAVWDYQRISGGDSSEIEVNLYAVKREVVNQLVGACKSADLPVRGIALAPLGIYNFVKYELDMIVSDACVCVDIGTENTDLLIIDGERTWMRIIPAAGMELTKALLSKFKKLKPEQAEQLKRKVGRPQEVATLFKVDAEQAEKICAQAIDAMKEPLKELVGEIYRSVGFYKGQNEDVLLNKLVMMGNGSKQHNIQKFFAQQLQYDVHRVDDLTSVLPQRTLDPSEVKKNVQSLAVAIGLALQAVEVPGLNTTNLIPAELIIEEKLERVRPMAIAAGGIVALGGIITLLGGLMRQPQVNEEASRLANLNSQAQSNLAVMQDAMQKDAELTKEVTTLNNVSHGRDLVFLTSQLVTDSMATFFRGESTSPGGDATEIICDMPQSFIDKTAGDDTAQSYGRHGVDIRLMDATLTNVPEQQEGAEPLDEFALQDLPYKRSVHVQGTINFAALVGTLQPAEDIPSSMKRAADRKNIEVAQAFQNMVAGRLELLLKPDSDFNTPADRMNQLKAEFGEDKEELITSLSRLRDYMPAMSVNELKDQKVIELTGAYFLHSDLSRSDEIFPDKQFGGLRRDRLPTPSTMRTSQVPDVYYAHYALILRLHARPFETESDEAEGDVDF